MVVSTSEYEECRRQRLLENKKRMEELNLNKLAKALALSSAPNKSPMKTPKRVARLPTLPVRRSVRVSDKPAPNYRELGLEPVGRHVRSGCYKRRDLLNRVYASDENRINAIDRAHDVQSGLDPEIPSFVKPMLQSHVTGGFWLGLPNHFCVKHLPMDVEFMMTLEDEDGNESSSKYLGLKHGLSGGWRGWAIDHELVDGDALVFQLVEPAKFKVYIIRVDQPATLDDDEEKEQGAAEKEGVKKEISKVKPSSRKVKKPKKRVFVEDDDTESEEEDEEVHEVEQNKKAPKKRKSSKNASSDSDDEEKTVDVKISKDARSHCGATGTRRSVRKKLAVDYTF